MTSPWMNVRLTTRLLPITVAAALALGACSSDDDSATETSSAGTTAETTAGTTAGTTAETTAGTTAETTAETTGSDETVSTDTFESVAVDVTLPPIDDVPVCLAFGRIITTSFFVNFAGFSSDADAAAGVERVEVVAYAGLDDELATLQSDVPAELLPSLDPLLRRIAAARDALAEGGFTEAEIAEIASAWDDTLDAIAAGAELGDASSPDESLDETKLAGSAEAFVTAVGTFAEYSSSDNSSEADEQGEAWLAETCPVLAESFSDS